MSRWLLEKRNGNSPSVSAAGKLLNSSKVALAGKLTVSRLFVPFSAQRFLSRFLSSLIFMV